MVNAGHFLFELILVTKINKKYLSL